MTAESRNAHRTLTLAASMGVALVVALVAWSSPAQSTPQYLSAFNDRYDTSGSRLDTCMTCHTSSSPSADNINAYATDYAGNDHNFEAIESMDSDGDGFTNIEEINALTFPGDPEDNPDTAAEPEPTTTTTTAPPPEEPEPGPGLPLPLSPLS